MGDSTRTSASPTARAILSVLLAALALAGAAVSPTKTSASPSGETKRDNVKTTAPTSELNVLLDAPPALARTNATTSTSRNAQLTVHATLIAQSAARAQNGTILATATVLKACQNPTVTALKIPTTTISGSSAETVALTALTTALLLATENHLAFQSA